MLPRDISQPRAVPRFNFDELSVPAPGPRTAPPAQLGPQLPIGAVMPLPAGNCGCGEASEEVEL